MQWIKAEREAFMKDWRKNNLIKEVTALVKYRAEKAKKNPPKE